MIQHLEEKRAAGWGPHTKISKEEAVLIITSSSFQPDDVIGFNQNQAARLGLELGCTVSVAPTDTGKLQQHYAYSCQKFDICFYFFCAGRDNPTTGKLVALAYNEIVLEVQGKNAPTCVRCHFPILMYNIKKID
jgi:hypothetical protein